MIIKYLKGESYRFIKFPYIDFIFSFVHKLYF